MKSNKLFTEEAFTIIKDFGLLNYFSKQIGLDLDDLGDIDSDKLIWGNKFVEQLGSVIRYHEIQYANGKSIILDEDFDKLYMGLQDIEENYPQFILDHSPTQVLFSDFEMKDGKLVTLKYLSKSLPKCNDYKGLKTKIRSLLQKIFSSDSNITQIVCQVKDDGLTINLDYSGGKLVQAATRGKEGVEGYDILEFVKLMPSIPKTIDYKGDLSIKGEGVAALESMLEVNELLNDEEKYTQLRQFISSTFGPGRDISEVVRRNIFYSAYEIYNTEAKSYREDMELLKSLGFRTSQAHVFKTKGKDLEELVDEIYDYIMNFEENIRETLDHEIDGLVFRPLSNKAFKDAGIGEKVVNGGFAYKFTTYKSHAVLKDIELNLGTTGMLSYTGIVDPVIIKDSKVQRFSIPNFNYIKKWNLNIGSRVLLEKAGDIIPKLHSATIDDLPMFEEVTICPFCSEPLVLHVGIKGYDYFCENKDCDERNIQELIGFTSRDGGLNIPSLGKTSVRSLYENGLLNSIPDLYTLHEKTDKIKELPRFGERSVEKLIKGIEDSKTVGGAKVLSSLHKHGFGRSLSRLVLNKTKSYDNLLIEYHENQEEFLNWFESQEKIGPESVNVLKKFIEDEEIIEMLNSLKSYGVMLSEEEVAEKMSEVKTSSHSSTILVGKSICFTGKMKRVRKDLEAKASEFGATPAKTVTRSLDILVLADPDSTSSKANKAREYGTQIMSEEDFCREVGI